MNRQIRGVKIMDKGEAGFCQLTRTDNRVLVLEEDTSLCKMIRRQLANFNITVTTTNDLEACIHECKQSKSEGLKFAGAILDLNIAGEKVAVKILQKLRQIDPQIRAIVMSGNIYDETMIKYEQYGFKGALAKPFGKEELRLVLHRIYGLEFTLL